MAIRLTVVRDGERESFDYADFPVSIGRAPGNRLVLEDKKASRWHCVLERDESGAPRLRDLGSRNGTEVEGRRVEAIPLAPGQPFVIGTTSLAFDELSDAALGPLERENRNLRRLLEINRRIGSERDPDALLRLIIDTAIDLIGAERGFLILGAERGAKGAGEKSLRFRVARKKGGADVPEPEIEVSRTLADRVLESGRPILSEDAVVDERLSAMQSIRNLKVRSVLCVPFRGPGRPPGAIYVDNRMERGVFDDEKLRLLEAFADQAAIALETAGLLAENEKRRVELERSESKVLELNAELRGLLRRKSAELEQARVDLRETRAALSFKYDYRNIVGESAPMRSLFALLDRVTESSAPVLVQGESGTGKELIARAVHVNGPRREKRFVAVNCAAIAESLLESELFGHARGAFTGADRETRGLFEMADGGTLFLDEVGETSAAMQRRLLRALQEGEVRKVGGEDVIKVDVRIIAATNKDLKEQVRKGLFREDLFYRLNVVSVVLPPLRERREDVPLLIDRFIEKFCDAEKTRRKTIAPEAVEALQRYPWPGNVRELENEVRKLVALSGRAIGLESVSPHVRAGSVGPAVAFPTGGTLRERVTRLEKEVLLQVLEKHLGNKSAAAAELGLSRYGLRKKLERYGLSRPRPD